MENKIINQIGEGIKRGYKNLVLVPATCIAFGAIVPAYANGVTDSVDQIINTPKERKIISIEENYDSGGSIDSYVFDLNTKEIIASEKQILMNGNLIQNIHFGKNKELNSVSEIRYEFDNQDRIKKETEYIFDKLNKTSRRKITEKKYSFRTLEEYIDEDGDGNPDSINTFIDNIHGKIKEAIFQDTNGKLVQEYKYDERGDLEIITTIRNGLIESFEKYERNKNREVTEINKFSPTGLDETIKYQYEYGKKINKASNWNNSKDWKSDETVYAIGANEFNKNGSVIKKTVYFKTNGIPKKTTSYDYNKQGDLSKVIEDHDGDGLPDSISTITKNKGVTKTTTVKYGY